ncbi:putative NAD(P)H nitroreductase YfkO [invertebrate metagenome]|uniref:Putative NAD(P)H nitroreductase YfkO n=1 Tax=invertebrate metagenome TaxID=1711999 RepID=A0A2H9T711_9ZZZZ
MTACKEQDIQQQVQNAFHFRHATKVFDPTKKISEASFATILEAARLSPSSFGFEPWQLLVIQSPEKRELFREFSWGANGSSKTDRTAGQLGTASHFVVLLAHTDATMKHHSDYLRHFMSEVKKLPAEIVDFYHHAYQKFQENDFHIEGKRQITDWCCKQAYIALGNMMTAAAFLGIDSCPIEGFEKDKAAEVLEKHFDIDPVLYSPASMAAFGYRAQEPAYRKTRRPIDQVAQWF